MRAEGQNGGSSGARCVTDARTLEDCVLCWSHLVEMDGMINKRIERKKENWLPFNPPRAQPLTSWPLLDPVFLERRKGNPS